MQPKDEVIDHGQDYDGIKEYDNPLPRWFLMMFYITILFSFWYMAYYTAKTEAISKATGVSRNLAWSGTRFVAQQKAADAGKGVFTAPTGEGLEKFLRDPANIARGEALFKANCVACHGEHAQGIVGPNLTDKFWIHGGSREQIVSTLTTGWPEKGMPAWGPTLGPEKVHWLASYVRSVHGRNVENPKAPQGVEEEEDD